jgi:serine/threonine protein kinase
MEFASDVPSLDDAYRTWTMVSGRVEAFIKAWERGGDAPALGDFLPADPPAVRRMTLIELLKVDLEFRWSRGKAPRTVEEYLADFVELTRDLPADLIYEEYQIRHRAGDPITPQDYLVRFPEHAAELQRIFGLNPVEYSTCLYGGIQAQVQDIQTGERLDDFDLLVHLGKGAFASVFLARQNSIQRLVAVKISADRGSEPQTLAQLDHEHIVRVFDQRQLRDRGLRLLYMQYVSGGTLQGVVDRVKHTAVAERRGKLLLDAVDDVLQRRGETLASKSGPRAWIAHRPWPEVVCWLGAKLARALDHAHRHGVLHRDIKPSNILVTPDGSPRLADFNIGFSSKVAGATPAAYFGGTIAYMSPEQLEASNPAHERTPDSLDGRSDLYALAVVLWELLTGARPFADEQLTATWGATLAELTARRRKGVDRKLAARLSRNWLPGLRAVLLACLDPDPAKRPVNGGEMARRLDLCLQPKAQALLSPPILSWRRLMRYIPLTSVVAGTALPNAFVFLAVINHHYDRQEIISQLQVSPQAFGQIQTLINGVAFLLGIAILIWFTWPVTAGVRGARNAQSKSADVMHCLRLKCLRLGHVAAAISLISWVIAALAYTITLHIETAAVPLSAYVHFVPWLALSVLMCAAYVFLIVSCLAVRSFYPALVRVNSMTDNDLPPLIHLGRTSRYSLLAATIPMLTLILILIPISSAIAVGNDIAPGAAFGLLLIASTLPGFPLAIFLSSTLQSSLSTLKGIVEISTKPL